MYFVCGLVDKLTTKESIVSSSIFSGPFSGPPCKYNSYSYPLSTWFTRTG